MKTAINNIGDMKLFENKILIGQDLGNIQVLLYDLFTVGCTENANITVYPVATVHHADAGIISSLEVIIDFRDDIAFAYQLAALKYQFVLSHKIILS